MKIAQTPLSCDGCPVTIKPGQEYSVTKEGYIYCKICTEYVGEE